MANAGAISIALVAVFGLLLLILFRGMSHFWPADVESFHYKNQHMKSPLLQKLLKMKLFLLNHYMVLKMQKVMSMRYLVKTGNRDILGSDFGWLYDIDLLKREKPKNIMALERIEWEIFTVI